MGYKDGLIQRLKDDGGWDQLTGEQQHRFQSLTEDKARQLMVWQDGFDMGESRAHVLAALSSTVRLIELFQGALMNLHVPDKPRLSEAGELLARFFLELRDRGVSSEEIDDGLRQLPPYVIDALVALYKGPPRES